MRAFIAAGFNHLELDGQTLTADTITEGRIPVTHPLIIRAYYR